MNESVNEDERIGLIVRLLETKYVIRADERQKAMGLSYVTAETRDMAKLISRVAEEIAFRAVASTPLAAWAIARAELTDAMTEAVDG